MLVRISLIVPISQRRKLRLREVKRLTLGTRGGRTAQTIQPWSPSSKSSAPPQASLQCGIPACIWSLRRGRARRKACPLERYIGGQLHTHLWKSEKCGCPFLSRSGFTPAGHLGCGIIGCVHMDNGLPGLQSKWAAAGLLTRGPARWTAAAAETITAVIN